MSTAKRSCNHTSLFPQLFTNVKKGLQQSCMKPTHASHCIIILHIKSNLLSVTVELVLMSETLHQTKAVIYQGMWNAAMRDFERDIIPMCKSEGIALAPTKLHPHFLKRQAGVGSLESLAEKKGSQLLQVALAYCMQKPPYVFPIVGGRKVEHIQGSIEGLNVELSEEEVAEIENAYPFDHGFPHTFLNGTMFKGTDELDQRQADGPGDVSLLKARRTFDWVPQPKAIRPSEAVKLEKLAVWNWATKESE
ncbi:hypothetical protein HZ326_25094 [Fusarium oxysporum f. sp. albedinis]|nr:hypothetical protein HZ326_25094 [Fusarium oxysporum f. sp. albedinis]